MKEIDSAVVGKVKALGESVAGLPEAVQHAAFQFLLQYHLDDTTPQAMPVEDAPIPPVAVPGPNAADDWVETLATRASVSVDDVRSIFDLDDEGFWITHPELGVNEAARLRNMSVLILWAYRIWQREIYIPQSTLYKAANRLGFNTKNLTNYIRSSKFIKPGNVRGEKMVQLVGEWEEEAKRLVVEYKS